MSVKLTGGSTCTSCGCSFTGDRDFDSHRAGLHTALYSAERPWGRRSLGFAFSAIEEAS